MMSSDLGPVLSRNQGSRDTVACKRTKNDRVTGFPGPEIGSRQPVGYRAEQGVGFHPDASRCCLKSIVRMIGCCR